MDPSRVFFKSEWKQSHPKEGWKSEHGESYEEWKECKCFKDDDFR